MTVEERFEKIEAGIRDLIIVSRTVLTSVQGLSGSVNGLTGSVGELRESVGELSESVGELRDAQKHTDEMLNALMQAQAETEHKVARLVETVDRLIRYRGPNGQGGKIET